MIFPSWPRSIFWPAVLLPLILVAASSPDGSGAISAPGATTPGTPLPTATVVEPLISMSDLPDDPTDLMFAMLDESGGEWRPVDNVLTSLNGPGRSLPQVASRNTYWFNSGAFYPHMGVYSPYPLPFPTSCCARTAPFTRNLVVYLIDTNFILILN